MGKVFKMMRFTLSKSVSRRWEKVKESTRKAGEERGVRLRQAQKEGGGGEEGSVQADRLILWVQGGGAGRAAGAKGGGGEQRDGESIGGGGRMTKWM
jgi:hypothetical protein